MTSIFNSVWGMPFLRFTLSIRGKKVAIRKHFSAIFNGILQGLFVRRCALGWVDIGTST
jgi:hypothetical protein